MSTCASTGSAHSTLVFPGTGLSMRAWLGLDLLIGVGAGVGSGGGVGEGGESGFFAACAVAPCFDGALLHCREGMAHIHGGADFVGEGLLELG